MSLVHRRYRATLVLAAACAVMAGIVLTEYRQLQRRVTDWKPETAAAVAPRPPRPPAPPAEFRLPPLGPDSAFVSHPLFIEGRQPIAEESTGTGTDAQAPAPTGPPPAVTLIGILDTPETRLVLLRDKRGGVLRRHPDETVDGWRIGRIEADRVVLIRNGREHTLPLVKPRKAPKPRPRPPRPKGRKPGTAFANPFTKTGKKSP